MLKSIGVVPDVYIKQKNYKTVADSQVVEIKGKNEHVMQKQKNSKRKRISILADGVIREYDVITVSKVELGHNDLKVASQSGTRT